MKRVLFFLIILVTATTATVAEKKPAQPRAQFTTLSHDFGTIKEENGPVSFYFEFKNVGNKPLLIVDAVASCGCTRPEYPAKPIKPGKKGKIKVTYSPIGRPGAFRKSVKIKTNGEERVTSLMITGTVVPKR